MSEIALEHEELKEELKEEVIEEEVDLGYRPRDPQLIIHQAVENNRFNVVVAHRRMGKTVSAINQLIHSALKCDKPNPRFAYIAPTYNQAKRVAWDYLLRVHQTARRLKLILQNSQAGTWVCLILQRYG
jgi:hypothetical protein